MTIDDRATRKSVHRYAELFLRSCALIFILTGIVKVVSTFGTSGILTLNDPVIGLPNRWVMLFAAGFELIVAVFLLKSASQMTSLYLVSWVSTSFVVYKVVRISLKVPEPCSCLGRLTELGPWMNNHLTMITWALIGFLWCGSAAFLLPHYFRNQLT